MPRKGNTPGTTGKKKEKKKSVVYHRAYYDENGKRRGKSFSAPTMAEAIKRADEWELLRGKPEKPRMTVLSVVEKYIASKESVLSPSTVAAYKDMKRVHIKDSSIAEIEADKLSDTDVQLWISELAADGLGTKSIRNCYSLLSAAEKMFYKKSFDVSIGQQKKPDLYCPSNDDVEKLLQWIRSKKRSDLERAVLLAAFGPLRRGEICALTSDDIHGNCITVNKAVVRNENNAWEIKAPKTLSSYRTLEMPGFVMEKLSGIDGKLINYTPHSLGEAFREAVRESGVPHFRFHDLRHYAASIMNYNGISDRTVMSRGGWATTHVMKRVYQNEIDAETKRETEKVMDFFTSKFA